MEKYRETKKDLHMLFIDLIKSYEKFLLVVLQSVWRLQSYKSFTLGK